MWSSTATRRGTGAGRGGGSRGGGAGTTGGASAGTGEGHDDDDDDYNDHNDDVRGTSRIFVALFDYDPPTMSPNPEACDEELPFREGQLIKVSIHT